MAELPSIDHLISVLQKCRKKRILEYAKSVHAHMCYNGLESHRSVENYIVPMFVECGSVPDAQHIFNRLHHRDVYSWTSLISGYIECGKMQHALDLYQKMQEDSVRPSSHTYMTLLRACARLKDVGRGREIHIRIAQKGFESDVFVGSTLVDMYAKCGSLAEAREVFDKLPLRDVVSWNALIGGYAEHGFGQESLKCFEQMKLEGISADAVTFVCTLKACASVAAIDKGREVHTDIMLKGFERVMNVGNTLVDMYAKCGLLSKAREVFDQLLSRDVVSWNALIAGYAEHGPGQEALKCCEQMQLESVFPDRVTLVCVLKACGRIGAIGKGREVHADIIQKGVEGDVSIGSTLVDMYAKCGSLVEAQKVFDKLPIQVDVSWNSLIAGYAEHGAGQEALKCFEEMQRNVVSPDAVTFVCVLKACGSIEAIDKGREIHAQTAQTGFGENILVGSALVDMYAKCGSLVEAGEVFDNLPVRKLESWTALITGYAEHGFDQEALKCFEQMQLEGISPDAVTFVCILKLCGNIGAIDKGRELHADIALKGFERDVFVGGALVDMYARCGSPAEASEVFDNLPDQNFVSWTAMVKGYGMNREGNMAIQCFTRMQEEGVKPDDITFTCLLTACSRAGLVLKGREFFNMMREEYGIAPTIEHYTCIVDLLAKSGHLNEAEKFIETMPSPPLWTALLSACEVYREAELGLRCFQQLVQMTPDCAAPYVLMAKIYASAGRWDDAYSIEELRKQAGVKKKPANVLIEVNKQMHEFVVGNKQNKELLAFLEILSARVKEEGHVPNVNLVTRPIPDEEKEVALCKHAEKLAIAFGLLNTPQGQTLRASKNLRMCNDCHNTMKIISKIERREIIIREVYHIHRFKDGVCSCGDMH